MKRYLLFAFPLYYPFGGIGDLVGDYDSFDEVATGLQDYEYSWNVAQILDIETGKRYRWILGKGWSLEVQ